MPATEQQVRLAAKLYDARDAAKRLLGPRYAALMAQIGSTLQRTADATGRTTLSVATTAAMGAGGMDAVVILAAAVELAEPSVEVPAA